MAVRFPITVAGFHGVVCMKLRETMAAGRDLEQLLIAAEPPDRGNWARSFILTFTACVHVEWVLKYIIFRLRSFILFATFARLLTKPLFDLATTELNSL